MKYIKMNKEINHLLVIDKKIGSKSKITEKLEENIMKKLWNEKDINIVLAVHPLNREHTHQALNCEKFIYNNKEKNDCREYNFGNVKLILCKKSYELTIENNSDDEYIWIHTIGF